MTAKQQRFVEEYVVDFNGTEAAIRAGYSPKTAHSIGWENLRKPEIQKHIRAEIERLQKATGVTAEEVIRGLHAEAQDKSEGSKHSARVSAWSWLGKHFRLFTERHEHTVQGEVVVTEVILEYPEEE